ncbi:MAG: CBS domain-containing protein [Anaerolineales bacterium]|nr:CBS domain-containing protein [Anaerolineales bacterium]
MKNAFRVLRIRGIDIRIHYTFPLILFWAAFQFGFFRGRGLEGAIFGIVVTSLLFVIVVLHEMGHSVAALHYGVPVKEIVLLPIGGVAQLGRMPEKPIQEFVIAIAGPLVNFVLAFLLGLVAIVVGVPVGISTNALNLSLLASLSLASVFTYIFISNIIIGVFNLLPAFPMDGGRILRSLLAMRLEYTRATSIAVTFGQIMAVVLGIWGLMSGSFFLAIIAFFIFISAGQEGKMTKVRGVLNGVKVKQVFSRDALRLSPQSTLREAADLAMKSFQSDFPVFDEDRYVGMLPYADLIEAMRSKRTDTPVAEVMKTQLSTVGPEDGLFEVQMQLAESGENALPVVEGDQFLGLITGKDIGEIYRLLSRKRDLFTAKGTS